MEYLALKKVFFCHTDLSDSHLHAHKSMLFKEGFTFTLTVHFFGNFSPQNSNYFSKSISEFRKF